MSKLKPITVKGEEFLFSLSFDIDDFIGDGVWWLQIYNSNQSLIYDKHFSPSISRIDKRRIIEIIKNEFLIHRGALL